MTAVGASKKKPTKTGIQLGFDVARVAASLIAIYLLLFGYVYWGAYFRAFGLSISEVDISYFQAIFHVFAILQDSPSLLPLPLFGVAGFGLLFLYRKYIPDTLYYFLFVFVFAGYFYLVWFSAKTTAVIDSDKMKAGLHGRITICELKKDAGFSDDFLETFDKATWNAKVRKLHETDSTLYLVADTRPGFLVSSTTPENAEPGEEVEPDEEADEVDRLGGVYSFNKSDVIYCHTISERYFLELWDAFRRSK